MPICPLENVKLPPFRTFLKWLAGIMLLAVFTITTGIYIIYRITAPDIAVPALGRIMESAVQGIPMGSIDRVREEVMRRGNLTVEPVAGITVQCGPGKNPGAARPGSSGVILFREAAAPLYAKGADAFLVHVSDSGVKNRLSSFGRSLQYLAEDFHGITRTALIIFGALNLLLFIFLFFSQLPFRQAGKSRHNPASGRNDWDCRHYAS